MKKEWGHAIGIVLCVVMVIACGSPEEKKAKFYNKGKTLFESGESIKAQLELKNALQIDSNYAPAYFMLGKIELKRKEYKRAYGYFSKAIEMDADLLDAYVERGKILLMAKIIDEARKDCHYVLDKQTNHTGGRLLRAGILLAEKKQEAAREIVQTVMGEGVTDPLAYQMLASIAFSAKDIEKGLKVLRDGMKANPDDIHLRALMVSILTKEKKFEEAIAVVKEAIAMEPEQKAHPLKLAALYWETGRKEAAAELFSQMMDKDKNPVDLRILAADFYAKHKDIKEAKAVINEGIGQEEKNIPLRLALSRLQVAAREHDQAQKTLQTALGLTQDNADPDLLKVKNQLARFHLGKGEIDRAKLFVDEVIAVSGNNADAQFSAGQIYLHQKDGLNAVSAFRTVVAEKPEAVNGHLHLAQAHLLNKEKQLAIDALTNGLKANPKHAALRKALARIYTADKEHDRAERELRLIVENAPDNLRVQADLADFLFTRDRVDEAIAIYEKMVEDQPQIPAGYLRLAGIYQTQKKAAAAKAILEKGYDRIPQSAPILTNLVRGYLSEGNQDKATDLLKARLGDNDKDLLANNLLGEIYLSRKAYDDAERQFEAAIALRPEWEIPQNNLARTYLIQGKENEAIEKLTAALDENPKNAAAYLTLGHLYKSSGQTDRVIGIYQKALEVLPNYWPVVNNLAYTLAENGNGQKDLDRARELALRAVKLQPERPDVIDTLGWVYYKRGETDLAISELQKASERAQDSVVISYHLGMALMKVNRLDEARELLEKVVTNEDFSERETAKKALATLKAG